MVPAAQRRWSLGFASSVQCCFTSTETVRTLRDREAQGGHRDFRTAPELWDFARTLQDFITETKRALCRAKFNVFYYNGYKLQHEILLLLLFFLWCWWCWWSWWWWWWWRGGREGALRNQWTVVGFAKMNCEHKDLNFIPGQYIKSRKSKWTGPVLAFCYLSHIITTVPVPKEIELTFIVHVCSAFTPFLDPFSVREYYPAPFTPPTLSLSLQIFFSPPPFSLTVLYKKSIDCFCFLFRY